MPSTVETDVRTRLLNASISGVTSNMCFMGAVRKPGQGVPHRAIFVIESGGLMPQEYMDGFSSAYRRNDFQVRIRSDVGDYAGGKAMAESVWLALNKYPLTGASVSYVRCYCLQGSPVYIGQDDGEHDEWVVNGRAEFGG